MVEYKKGYFAKSKAGHDKGKTYIIIEETFTSGQEEFVMVSDGDLKPVEKPKKKKKIHLQVVLRRDEILEERMKNGQEIRNEDIKRAIKDYINK